MSSFKKKTQVVHVLSIHLYFLVFLFISITQFTVTSHGCSEEDRSALLNFKNSLKDESNRLSSWREGKQHENCCDWLGIGCSNVSSRVISIDLRNKELENYIQQIGLDAENKSLILDYYSSYSSSRPSTSLNGNFPASLLKVTHLEYLDLAFNDFQASEIPHQFSNLTKLVHLDLSYSNLSSSIPTQFSNLSSLEYLDLSCFSVEFNFATTCLDVPSMRWLAGLVNLQELRLSGISFWEATSEAEIFEKHMSHLFNLRVVDLSSCSIAHPVLLINGFQNCSRLSSLKMNGIDYLYQSTFPIQLANLTSLSVLELVDCGLLGPVPYLPQLKELDVSYNSNLRVDLTSITVTTVDGPTEEPNETPPLCDCTNSNL